MFMQAVYPVECQHIASCQKQFRQQILNKIRNLGQYPLEVPLEDGQIVYMEVRLYALTETYGEYHFIIQIDSFIIFQIQQRQHPQLLREVLQ